MSWNSIKSFVGQYAPLAGSLLGGSAGEAVGSLIANALGVKAEPEAIAAELRNNPEAALKLKQMEFQHRGRLQELQFNTLKTELQDKQHARQSHKDHWMPALLTVLLAAMTVGMFLILSLVDIPEGRTNLIYYIVGQVVTAFLTAVAYWLGTSRSSKEKDKRWATIT